MLRQEFVIALSLVILVEFIQLYDLYQSVGILGIGGITRCLQTARPTLIIVFLQFEQRTVSLSAGKKLRVILE